MHITKKKRSKKLKIHNEILRERKRERDRKSYDIQKSMHRTEKEDRKN